MLAYALWLKEIMGEGEEAVLEQFINNASSSLNDQSWILTVEALDSDQLDSRNYQKARQYFEASQRLSATNEMFLYYYLKVLRYILV